MVVRKFEFENFAVKVHGKFGVTPRQADDGDVGFDLFIPGDEDIHMPYGSRRMIDTGVIVQADRHMYMLVVPRSSTGTSRAKGVRIANTIGIIDPKYQGKEDTIKVMLEREAGPKLEYVGTFTHVPSTTYPTVLAQAQRAFNVTGDVQCVPVGAGKYAVYAKRKEDEGTLVFEAGSRFVQMIFSPYFRPTLEASPLEDFVGKSRSGFGSTGTK